MQIIFYLYAMYSMQLEFYTMHYFAMHNLHKISKHIIQNVDVGHVVDHISGIFSFTSQQFIYFPFGDLLLRYYNNLINMIELALAWN